ncbi:MAG: hemerythrin family protein [Thalassolituus sp.]
MHQVGKLSLYQNDISKQFDSSGINMSMVFWDYPKLPVSFMNEEHEVFIGLMNDAEQSLTMGTFQLQHFRRLVQHCQEHFAHEEREMLKAGFPAYRQHKAEHDRTLMVMNGLLKQYDLDENIEPLLNFIQDTLPDWFSAHITTLDTVTAHFLANHSTRAKAG